jgi:tRNA(fMet)-specific endonuclease VapC
MKYLLDTNACIRYINGRSLAIREKLRSIDRRDVGVSIITRAELYYGSEKSQTPQRSREKQLEFLATVKRVEFDEQCALAYGKIRANLEQQGTPIGANDLLIAATAVANNLVLITHNTREFGKVPSLNLEDWELEDGSI